MPESSPKSVADRALHSTDGNVHPNLDGSVELLRECLFSNWPLGEISETGDPEGLGVRLPPNPGGIHVYLSEEGAGPETLARQTPAPLPPTRPSYPIDHPFVFGSRPVPGPDSPLAARIPSPDKPRVKSETASVGGLAVGDYYLSWTLAERPGSTWLHTMLAPEILVNVPAAGTTMSVTMPPVDPALVARDVRVGLWLSPVGGTRSAMTLQRLVVPGGAYANLASYVAGRARPTANETGA